MAVALDTSGDSTSPKGFSATATYAGMKTYGDGKLDIGLLISDRPCAAAAVFTRNRLYSACIDVNREHLKDQRAQAVVVNAGIANSSTGLRGIDDARRVAMWVAGRFDLHEYDVLVCSTGVIGHYLPMDKMEAGVLSLNIDRANKSAGKDFARAIMTTDTGPKHASVTFGDYTLGGSCKGAGMIHPNMATMLAFLTTDAPVEPDFLQASLRRAADRSFNLVSIDGDTSPSDTVILLANGAAGGDTIDAESPLASRFQEALDALCTYLAKEIARDGEGATRVMETTVTGAASDEQARALVRLLTTSYLLKSAVHGADPNWGRIVSVIGRSGVDLDEGAVTVTLCGHRVFEDQRPTEFDEGVVAAAMQASEVSIEVHLGAGEARATGWGCDLSAEYVSINADYHT